MLFLVQIYTAQSLSLPSVTTGWERIYVKNFGSFDLPPTMEVQKGTYKENADEIKKLNGIDASQIIAQQKGLNKNNEEGFEKYGRVLFKTTYGQIGDFETLNFNITQYTQSDILELDSFFEKQFKLSVLGTKLKIIEWYPLKIEKINEMSCFHMSYKRQLDNNPFVLVHIYSFHNNDRMHTFTLSYRISELDYWESDFEKIIKSVNVSDIR